MLCGNIHGVFWDGEQHVPLIPFLREKARAGGNSTHALELQRQLTISSRAASPRAAREQWEAEIRERERQGMLG